MDRDSHGMKSNYADCPIYRSQWERLRRLAGRSFALRPDARSGVIC
ncbi:hypothetical protein SUS17_44 [Sphingomonas sp. S17]|nr:hypothetical protein SUS17_44 [Sphingomonas sp. S17]